MKQATQVLSTASGGVLETGPGQEQLLAGPSAEQESETRRPREGSPGSASPAMSCSDEAEELISPAMEAAAITPIKASKSTSPTPQRSPHKSLGHGLASTVTSLKLVDNRQAANESFDQRFEAKKRSQDFGEGRALNSSMQLRQSNKNSQLMQNVDSEGQRLQPMQPRWSSQARYIQNDRKDGESSTELMQVMVSTQRKSKNLGNTAGRPTRLVTQSSSEERPEYQKQANTIAIGGSKLEVEQTHQIKLKNQRSAIRDRKPLEVYSPPEAAEAKCFSAFSINPQAKDNSVQKLKNEIKWKYGLHFPQKPQLSASINKKHITSIDKVESLLDLENQITQQNSRRGEGANAGVETSASQYAFIGPGLAVNVQNAQAENQILGSEFTWVRGNQQTFDRTNLVDFHCVQSGTSVSEDMGQAQKNKSRNSSRMSKTFISKMNYDGFTVPRQPNFERKKGPLTRAYRKSQSAQRQNRMLAPNKDLPPMYQIPLSISFASPSKRISNPISPVFSSGSQKDLVVKIQDQGCQMKGQNIDILKTQQDLDMKEAEGSMPSSSTNTMIARSRPKSSVLNLNNKGFEQTDRSMNVVLEIFESVHVDNNQQEFKRGEDFVCSKASKVEDPFRQSQKATSSISMSQQLKQFEHQVQSSEANGEAAAKGSSLLKILEQHQESATIEYNALKIVDQNKLVDIPLTAQDDAAASSVSPMQGGGIRKASSKLQGKHPSLSSRRNTSSLGGGNLAAGRGYSVGTRAIFSARAHARGELNKRRQSKNERYELANANFETNPQEKLQIQGISKSRQELQKHQTTQNVARNDLVDQPNQNPEQPIILVPLSYLTDPTLDQPFNRPANQASHQGADSNFNNAMPKQEPSKKSAAKSSKTLRNPGIFVTHPVYLLTPSSNTAGSPALNQPKLYQSKAQRNIQAPMVAMAPQSASNLYGASFPSKSPKQLRKFSNYVQKISDKNQLISEQRLDANSEIQQRIFTKSKEPPEQEANPNPSLKLQPPASSTTLSTTHNPQMHRSTISRNRYFAETRKHAFETSSRNLKKYFGTQKAAPHDNSESGILKVVRLEQMSESLRCDQQKAQQVDMSMQMNMDLDIGLPLPPPAGARSRQFDGRPKTSQHANQKQFLYFEVDAIQERGSQRAKETDDSVGNLFENHKQPSNRLDIQSCQIQNQTQLVNTEGNEIKADHNLAQSTHHSVLITPFHQHAGLPPPKPANPRFIHQQLQSQIMNQKQQKQNSNLTDLKSISKYRSSRNQVNQTQYAATSVGTKLMPQIQSEEHQLFNAMNKNLIEYMAPADVGLQAKVEQAKSQMSTRRLAKAKMAKDGRSRPKTGKGEYRAKWNDRGLIAGEAKNYNISLGKSHRLVNNGILNSQSRLDVNITEQIQAYNESSQADANLKIQAFQIGDVLNKNLISMETSNKNRLNSPSDQEMRFLHKDPGSQTPDVYSYVQTIGQRQRQRSFSPQSLNHNQKVRHHSPIVGAEGARPTQTHFLPNGNQSYEKRRMNTQNSCQSAASKSAINLIYNTQVDTVNQSPTPVMTNQQLHREMYRNFPKDQDLLLNPLQEVRVYDDSQDVENRKGVEVLTSSNAQSGEDKAELALDGNDKEMFIDAVGPTIVDQVDDGNSVQFNQNELSPNQSPGPSQSQATHGTYSNYLNGTKLPRKLASGLLYRDNASASADPSKYGHEEPQSPQQAKEGTGMLSTVERESPKKLIKETKTNVSLAIRAIKSRPSQVETRDQETGGLVAAAQNTQPGQTAHCNFRLSTNQYASDLSSLMAGNNADPGTKEFMSRFKAVKTVPTIASTEYTKFNARKSQVKHDQLLEQHQQRFMKKKPKTKKLQEIQEQELQSRELRQPTPNRFRSMMCNQAEHYHLYHYGKSYDKVVKTVDEFKQRNQSLKGDGAQKFGQYKANRTQGNPQAMLSNEEAYQYFSQGNV